MSVSCFRKKRLAIPNSSFPIPNFIRSLLVRGVDDFHKVSGLQAGPADQAAVLVVAKSAPGGTP